MYQFKHNWIFRKILLLRQWFELMKHFFYYLLFYKMEIYALRESTRFLQTLQSPTICNNLKLILAFFLKQKSCYFSTFWMLYLSWTWTSSFRKVHQFPFKELFPILQRQKEFIFHNPCFETLLVTKEKWSLKEVKFAERQIILKEYFNK